MTDNLRFFNNYQESSKSILEKYNHFTDLDDIQYPFKELAKDKSSIVNKITFKNKKDSETFDTVFKTGVSGAKKGAGLYYEFFVGRAINELKKYYPNFIQTLVYINLKDTYPNDNLLDYNFNDNKRVVYNTNSTKEELFTENLVECGCLENFKSAILIEYVPKSRRIKDLFMDREYIHKDSFDYNMFTLLFQIYATIYALRDKFCHNDLHLDNVMLIELEKEIIITYIIQGIEYKLFTKYRAVIIDYYSCIIKYKDYNSNDFVEIACKTQCNTHKELDRRKYFKTCNESIDKLREESSYYREDNVQDRLINKCYLNDFSINSLYNKQSHRLINKSNDLYLINILMYQYSMLKNNYNFPPIPDFNLKTVYKKIFNENTSPEWFRENSSPNNYDVRRHVDEYITPVQKAKYDSKKEEFYCDIKCDKGIYKTPKYAYELITHFLIPYYNETNLQLKIPSHSTSDNLTIYCDEEKEYVYIPYQGGGYFKDKYLKYKNKYLNLKKQFS